MERSSAVFWFVVFIVCASCALGQKVDLDVPFVPTRMDIVEAMLDIADVGSDDILYDLGCGDGRIVIMAAEKFGTSGIGVDLNPDRVDESIMNAAAAGVNDHVSFVVQDIFDTDFSEASVITMYLLPHVNIKLRPKLFAQVKPGTRIVSHDFDMGQWEPDESRTISTEKDNHYVYFWVVPARVAGQWRWSVRNDLLERDFTLDIVQEYQQVVGTVSFGTEAQTLEELTLRGDTITFTMHQTIDGRDYVMAYSGTVTGAAINGTIETTSGTTLRNCSWSATCDPATMTPWEVDD